MDRITVRVLADDPVSEAGVTSLLRPFPGISLHHASQPASATVVATGALDDTGWQLLRTAQQTGPTRMILVIPRLQDHQIKLAAESGVSGIVWRTEATAHRLIDAIQTVVSGSGHLPSDFQERLMRLYTDHRGDVVRLTAHASEILYLISNGLSTDETARQLSCSSRAIRAVLHNVTTRYDLRNRTHAVAFALRRRLID